MGKHGHFIAVRVVFFAILLGLAWDLQAKEPLYDVVLHVETGLGEEVNDKLAFLLGKEFTRIIHNGGKITPGSDHAPGNPPAPGTPASGRGPRTPDGGPSGPNPRVGPRNPGGVPRPSAQPAPRTPPGRPAPAPQPGKNPGDNPAQSPAGEIPGAVPGAGYRFIFDVRLRPQLEDIVAEQVTRDKKDVFVYRVKIRFAGEARIVMSRREGSGYVPMHEWQPQFAYDRTAVLGYSEPGEPADVPSMREEAKHRIISTMGRIVGMQSRMEVSEKLWPAEVGGVMLHPDGRVTGFVRFRNQSPWPVSCSFRVNPTLRSTFTSPRGVPLLFTIPKFTTEPAIAEPNVVVQQEFEVSAEPADEKDVHKQNVARVTIRDFEFPIENFYIRPPKDEKARDQEPADAGR